MIFVTAGTQEPFDRLIEVMDEIASDFRDVSFIVQAFPLRYKAKNFEVVRFLEPSIFDSYIDKTELIISHAGMGTIISAMVKKKPIIIMPRLIKYHEHRNEHQLATAKKLDSLGYVDVAYDENELKNKFFAKWPDNFNAGYALKNTVSNNLIKSLNDFIKY